MIMKKIISFLLLLIVLISCFTTSVLAAESVVQQDNIDYNPIDKNVFKETSDGIIYNTEFSRFIDVKKYSLKLGLDGYNEYSFLGIDEYYRKSELSYYVLYVFNPQRERLNFNSSLGDEKACCYVDVIDSDGKEYTAVGIAELPSNDDNAPVFYRIFIPTELGSFKFPSFAGSEVRSFTIAGIRTFDTSGNVNKKILLMQTFNFSGFNAEKQLTFNNVSSDIYRSTSPLFDLGYVFGNYEDIKNTYPEDSAGDFEVAFFNESGYGTDKYNLYLYIYSPRKIKPSSVSISIFNFETLKFETLNFNYVNKDGTILKFVAPGTWKNSNEKYREYLFTDANITYKLSGDSSYRPLRKYNISDDFKYYFGEYSLSNYNPCSFHYSTTYSVTAKPGDKIFVSVENESISSVSVDTYVSGGDYIYSANISGSYDSNYFITEVVRAASETCILEFGFLSDFPIHKGGVTVQIGVNDNEPFSYFISSSELNIGKIVGYSLELLDDSSSSKGFYLAGEKMGNLKVEAGYTFYRLNNSKKGEKYYNTLSSLYFSVPESIFEGYYTDKLWKDGYVSSILMSYQSAMLQPGIIYQSGSDAAHNINRIQNGVYNSGGACFYSDFILGSFGSGPVGLNNGFSFGKHLSYLNYVEDPYATPLEEYDKFPYAFEFTGDWDPDKSGFSSDELVELIGDSPKLYENLQYFEKIIKFNDDYTLEGYHELSFKEQWERVGFFAAIGMQLGLLDNSIDAGMTFKGIDTLRGNELVEACSLSDEVFSDTYAVHLLDVPQVKEKMLWCSENNQAFVFLRFDIFDYYYSEAKYYYSDFLLRVDSIDISGQQYVFQTKYYKDVDILQLQTSNFLGNKKVYDVKMEPITVVGAVTPEEDFDDLYEKPGDAFLDGAGNLGEAIVTGGRSIFENSLKENIFMLLVTAIIIIVIVAVLTICFPSVMLPLINKTITLIAHIFTFVINLISKAIGFVIRLIKKE